MYSDTKENYIKTIYQLHEDGFKYIKTNELANKMNTKASSVTDMIQKLNEADLLNYTKYQGVKLNENGIKLALNILRKHRLWEYFLVEKLNFEWQEVHEIAEELEHISSTKLIDKLDDFLGNPQKDPHGDWIPQKNDRKSPITTNINLTEIPDGKWVQVKKVTDNLKLLQLLNQKNISIEQVFQKVKTNSFDQSIEILKDTEPITLSKEIAQQLIVIITK